MPKPTRDLIERVKRTIKTAADAEYFFDSLTSPDWIEPLRQADMFARPPEAIREGDYIRFPSWAQSRYLARMAANSPEEVSAIIKTLPRTDNMRILNDLAEAVLAMPPEIAVGLHGLVSSWLDTPNYLLLPDKVARLIVKLSAAGMAGAGLELAGQLFALVPDPSAETSGEVTFELLPRARSRLRTYEYGRALSQVLPSLTAGAGLETLEWLAGLASTAIKLSLTSHDETGQDYSSIWFSAIESNREREREIKSMLVAALRDCAESLVKTDPSMLDEVVARLQSRTYPVFTRVALYLIQMHAPSGDAAVVAALTNQKLLFGAAFHHEYWTLLESRFAQLQDSDRATILAAIDAGPEEYRENTFNELTLRDKARYLAAWQVRMLAAIKDDLPPEWDGRYTILISLVGEPAHPSLLSRGSGMWVGPTSPLTASQLGSMRIVEIVQFLHAWDPPADDWKAPSAEGLGQALEMAVAKEPDRFAIDAIKFRGVAPPYLRALFWGWRRATTNELVFSWGDVLMLADSAITQSSNTTVGNTEADMVALRKSVVDVIGPGLADGPAEIPYALRLGVWSLLERLASDTDPRPELEGRAEPSMDPFTLAINSVRGQAISSVVAYSLWVRRHVEAARAPEGIANGLEAMPEVRPVLDQHVDPALDASPAVHSMFGRWFPWLMLVDNAWTVANLTSVFPADEELSQFWAAAWDAYVLFSGIFDLPFHMLQGQYRRAIERIPTGGRGNKPRPSDVDGRLAEHLMVMYWRGRIDLAADGLLEKFFASADDGLRAHAIGFVGRSLLEPAAEDSDEPSPTIPAEVLDRLMKLWEARAEASEADAGEGPNPELSEFGWWFASGVFEDIWATNELIRSLRRGDKMDAGHLVLERLAVVAQGQPLLAMEALRLLIRSDKDGWTMLPWEGEIEAVLTTAIASQVPEARDVAIEVIHELGARGGMGYRRLLPKKDGGSLAPLPEDAREPDRGSALPE